MGDPDAVLLNFNENPQGPFPEARAAAGAGMAQAHRYLFGPQRELVEVFAAQNQLREDQVAGYCGSGVALDREAYLRSVDFWRTHANWRG